MGYITLIRWRACAGWRHSDVWNAGGWENPVQYAVQLEKPLVYDGGDYLWFHPRAAVADASSQEAVITLQRYLNRSDYYSGLYAMYSRNGGGTMECPGTGS